MHCSKLYPSPKPYSLTRSIQSCLLPPRPLNTIKASSRSQWLHQILFTFNWQRCPRLFVVIYAYISEGRGFVLCHAEAAGIRHFETSRAWREGEVSTVLIIARRESTWSAIETTLKLCRCAKFIYVYMENITV